MWGGVKTLSGVSVPLVLPYPREDGPLPPAGDPHYHRTHTFSGTESALQNERRQQQDCLAFTLIRDAAVCITVL